jgi:hypothetical protein
MPTPGRIVRGRPRATGRRAARPWGRLAAIDLHGCRPERLAVDHVCRLVPALLETLGVRARGELALHAAGPAGARELLLVQALTAGWLTVRVDAAGRRCLVDLALRVPFDADAAARVVAAWLDGSAHLTLLERGATVPDSPA